MSGKDILKKIKTKTSQMSLLMKGALAVAFTLVITALFIYLATTAFSFSDDSNQHKTDQSMSNLQSNVSRLPTKNSTVSSEAATTDKPSEMIPQPSETSGRTSAITDVSTGTATQTAETVAIETTTHAMGSTETTASETTSTGLTQDEIDSVLQAENDLTHNYLLADEMLALQQKALTFLHMRSLQMGVYYYDLNTGAYFTINAERQFRSASTAKVFTVMAMYEAVNEGLLDLDQEVTYTENDYEGGSGILVTQEEIGTYTLRDLAEYAILHSDNIAFHMIMRTVGRTQVYDYYEKIIGHETNRTSTQMSAADAVALLRHLYRSDNPYFPIMIEDMRQTDFNQAIPRYLPENSVSNKIGFYMSYFHDIAIIHDDEPYILAVFSESILEDFNDDPENLLADLSKLIYENR